MRNQANFKLILIGFFSASIVIAALSFKNNGPDQQGRFQSSVGQPGVVILDTQTGDYIINTDGSNVRWRKGTFSRTFQYSR